MSRLHPATILVALSLAALSACDKVALLAPTGSSLTISVSRTSIPIGGTAEVTAVVVENGGSAPQNGTAVTFSSTFGTMTPQEALTTGGVARATFTGTGSGSAEIAAFSGGAKVTAPLVVKVGTFAASAVSVRTEPATIPQSGGTVTVIGTVLDERGGALPNTLVTFTVDSGNLSSSGATSDANGEARVTLTTNRTTKVNASVGTVKATEFTLTALANPTVSFGTCTPTPPSVGVAVSCTIKPATQPATPLQNVTVNWGDNTGEQPLGAISGDTISSHTYDSPGTFTVTATAIDLNGQRGTASIALIVQRILPTISITANPTTSTVGAPITFSITSPATGSTASQPITGVAVDFGDGGSRNLGVISGTTTVQRSYASEGIFTVTATVTDQSGQRGTASTQVAIGRGEGPKITFNQAGTTPSNKTFSISATTSAGLSLRSIVVTRGGTTVYSGLGGTFVVSGAMTAGEVLAATATDSAGNQSTFLLTVTAS